MRRMWLFFLGLALIVLALACTGSSPGGDADPGPVPVVATRLTYTQPTGTGWRWMQEPGSTSGRLILGLYAPTNGRAVAFTVKVAPGVVGHYLEAPPRMEHRAYLSGDLVGVFSGTGAPLPSTPLALMVITLTPGSPPGPVAFTVQDAQGVGSGPVSAVAVEVGLLQAAQ